MITWWGIEALTPEALEELHRVWAVNYVGMIQAAWFGSDYTTESMEATIRSYHPNPAPFRPVCIEFYFYTLHLSKKGKKIFIKLRSEIYEHRGTGGPLERLFGGTNHSSARQSLREDPTNNEVSLRATEEQIKLIMEEVKKRGGRCSIIERLA